MSVTRNTPISIGDLNTLAGLANSKGIPGGPYSFTGTTWAQELGKMRSYLYSRFRWFNWPNVLPVPDYELSHPSKPSMLVSGPWAIAPALLSSATSQPPITNGTPMPFGSFPAGTYRVYYLGGAMKYRSNLQWQVNRIADGHCFKINYMSGGLATSITAPGSSVEFATETDCQSASLNSFVEFTHSGGQISAFLFDSPYSDNTASPTFGPPLFGLATTFGLQTVALAATETGTGYLVRGQVPTVKQNKFVYVGSTATIETRVELTDTYMPFIGDRLYTVGGSVNYYNFSIRGITGHSFDFEFVLPFIAIATSNPSPNPLVLVGADAADCTLTILGVSGGGGIWTITGVIRCSRTAALDFDFEVGIADSGTSVIAVDARSMLDVYSKKIRLTSRTPSAGHSEFPVIDQEQGYQITPPDMAAIVVTSPNADASDVWITNGYKFVGNQARITAYPTATEMAARGVWTGKTYPVGGSWFYESIIRTSQMAGTGALIGFNNAARSPTVETDDFLSIPRACEYMIPSYPVARHGETYQFNSTLPLFGAAIHSIYIRRMPVKSGDIWVDNPATQPLTVQLGCILQNQTFKVFQTFTIPAGQVELRASVFWIAHCRNSGVKFKLVYLCTEALRVEAPARLPLNGNGSMLAGNSCLSPYLSGFGGISFYPAYPILVDHFNDTETLLNLL